ncbi:MAG: cobalamin-independent methionine synthase II family protein [Gammaproteobacteria bacterium]
MSTNQRILTTHVGSLIRPPEFVALLREKEKGNAVPGFETALTAAVSKIVQEQAAVGIDVVSDGEFGKGIGWEQYVLERLEGFEDRAISKDPEERPPIKPWGDLARFAEFYAEYWADQKLMEREFVCNAPIRYTGFAALHRDINNLKNAIKGSSVVDGFLPVAAPASAVALSPNEYYKTDEEFIFATAQALREEYKAIIDAGLCVQIDDAHVPFAYDRMVPPATLEDYRRWAMVRIEALNEATKGLPEERMRYHLCWGSWNGPHTGDVPLKAIADLVLKVRVGAYAIEAANPRHEHEWKVWKDVKLPEGRKLIPGVISHATNIVEHPELVAERIVRFASVVGRENLMAGTDCGFAQGPFVRRVHPSIMWAKLSALTEGARLATRELWS